MRLLYGTSREISFFNLKSPSVELSFVLFAARPFDVTVAVAVAAAAAADVDDDGEADDDEGHDDDDGHDDIVFDDDDSAFEDADPK